jgi:hypothetical protein
MGIRTDTAISRILNQFIDAPNFVELFRRILYRFEDSEAILVDLATKRFIDTAEGVWLDYIGDIIGVARPYEPIPDDEIFTYKSIGESDDPDKGFGEIGSPTLGGVYQILAGITGETQATDEIYRLYIKAKAEITASKGTFRDIWGMVDFIFPTLTDINVTAPNVGEVQIETTPTLSLFERRLIENFAPVVAGIKAVVIV